MELPIYPPTLLPKHWNDNKGKFAKLSGKTGIGEALETLKKTWEGIDMVNLAVSYSYPSLEAVDQAIKDAKGAMPQLDKVKAQAYKARDVAKMAVGKFGKNPLLKAAAQLATQISADADKFGVELKGYDPSKSFEEARKRVENKLKVAQDALKNQLPKVKSGFDTLGSSTAKPTYDQWYKYWDQNLRGINAAIALVPSVKDQAPIWQKLTSQAFLGTQDITSDEIKVKIGQIKVAYNKLASAAG